MKCSKAQLGRSPQTVENTNIQIHRNTRYKYANSQNTKYRYTNSQIYRIQTHRNKKYKYTNSQKYKTDKYKKKGWECSVAGLGGSTRNSKYLSTEASNQPDGVVATIKSQARL